MRRRQSCLQTRRLRAASGICFRVSTVAAHAVIWAFAWLWQACHSALQLIHMVMGSLSGDVLAALALWLVNCSPYQCTLSHSTSTSPRRPP